MKPETIEKDVSNLTFAEIAEVATDWAAQGYSKNIRIEAPLFLVAEFGSD